LHYGKALTKSGLMQTKIAIREPTVKWLYRLQKIHIHAVPYREGVLGAQPPPLPPEIPNFLQSRAEFPVPWKIHRNNLIRILVSLICKLSGTPD
jgi:hypothetical protein